MFEGRCRTLRGGRPEAHSRQGPWRAPASRIVAPKRSLAAASDAELGDERLIVCSHFGCDCPVLGTVHSASVLIEKWDFDTIPHRLVMMTGFETGSSRRSETPRTLPSCSKLLHKIVNEAIRAQQSGEDHAEGLTVDLSRIDFAKLRDEFASKVARKHAVLKDVRDVEAKLAMMLQNNPLRLDYYKKYQEIGRGLQPREGPRHG
jgi:hypothetical protein